MTRFALIPLAFFANACASAEEVQELIDETSEEVREGFDSYEAETDRAGENRNKRALASAERQFRNELTESDCDLVGAVYGYWRDRGFRLNLTATNEDAKTLARLQGSLSFDSNNRGEIWAKGRTFDNSTMVLEGDWLNSAIEADIFTVGMANSDHTVFAKKTRRGLGGRVIGAVAVCNN